MAPTMWSYPFSDWLLEVSSLSDWLQSTAEGSLLAASCRPASKRNEKKKCCLARGARARQSRRRYNGRCLGKEDAEVLRRNSWPAERTCGTASPALLPSLTCLTSTYVTGRLVMPDTRGHAALPSPTSLHVHIPPYECMPTRFSLPLPISRYSDTGDNYARDQRPVAPTRKVLNLHAVLSLLCFPVQMRSATPMQTFRVKKVLGSLLKFPQAHVAGRETARQIGALRLVAMSRSTHSVRSRTILEEITLNVIPRRKSEEVQKEWKVECTPAISEVCNVSHESNSGIGPGRGSIPGRCGQGSERSMRLRTGNVKSNAKVFYCVRIFNPRSGEQGQCMRTFHRRDAFISFFRKVTWAEAVAAVAVLWRCLLSYCLRRPESEMCLYGGNEMRRRKGFLGGIPTVDGVFMPDQSHNPPDPSDVFYLRGNVKEPLLPLLISYYNALWTHSYTFAPAIAPSKFGCHWCTSYNTAVPVIAVAWYHGHCCFIWSSNKTHLQERSRGFTNYVSLKRLFLYIFIYGTTFPSSQLGTYDSYVLNISVIAGTLNSPFRYTACKPHFDFSSRQSSTSNRHCDTVLQACETSYDVSDTSLLHISHLNILRQKHCEILPKNLFIERMLTFAVDMVFRNAIVCAYIQHCVEEGYGLSETRVKETTFEKAAESWRGKGKAIGTARREHCKTVRSFVLSGDGAFDTRVSVTLIAPALLGKQLRRSVGLAWYGLQACVCGGGEQAAGVKYILVEHPRQPAWGAPERVGDTTDKRSCTLTSCLLARTAHAKWRGCSFDWLREALEQAFCPIGYCSQQKIPCDEQCGTLRGCHIRGLFLQQSVAVSLSLVRRFSCSHRGSFTFLPSPYIKYLLSSLALFAIDSLLLEVILRLFSALCVSYRHVFAFQKDYRESATVFKNFSLRSLDVTPLVPDACLTTRIGSLQRLIDCSRLNFTALSVLYPASFLHWLLHANEAKPFLTELHVIGAHNCEVFNYWYRVTQDVSDTLYSNDKRSAKSRGSRARRVFRRPYTRLPVVRRATSAAEVLKVSSSYHESRTSKPCATSRCVPACALARDSAGPRDPRETPPTGGIVRHESHLGKSGVKLPGIEHNSPWWEASRLTAKQLLYGFFSWGCSPLAATKANRVQSPAGSPDFRMWESCRTMSLVGEFSRKSPVSPAPSFRSCSTLTSITLIGSQDLAVKSRPNLFTHSLTHSSFHTVITLYILIKIDPYWLCAKILSDSVILQYDQCSLFTVRARRLCEHITTWEPRNNTYFSDKPDNSTILIPPRDLDH
ncbi:hypothetical protein PR048_005655 [Dryococelus australis]|uniref:Uncharacterized protein n=1 Tax=Dryococelus australis TaxID=614101 RepID=A0ABQ9I8R9_9NEOP|nr:hypothetical protein PR048_005655 [Dryococelus australis]